MSGWSTLIFSVESEEHNRRGQKWWKRGTSWNFLWAMGSSHVNRGISYCWNRHHLSHQIEWDQWAQNPYVNTTEVYWWAKSLEPIWIRIVTLERKHLLRFRMNFQMSKCRVTIEVWTEQSQNVVQGIWITFFHEPRERLLQQQPNTEEFQRNSFSARYCSWNV